VEVNCETVCGSAACQRRFVPNLAMGELRGHMGCRLGVLVEVNCETDFVARGDKFKQLVQDLAMQIAANPEVTVVAVEDVPAAELENERRIEMEKEDIKSKPEAIRCGLLFNFFSF
jgi:translation elongation factor EF-Ts